LINLTTYSKVERNCPSWKTSTHFRGKAITWVKPLILSDAPPLEENLKKANELKVIIQKPEDLMWAEENAAKVNPECLLYLQPEWKVSEQIMDTLTNYVMENTQWAISLQAHKYMKIP